MPEAHIQFLRQRFELTYEIVTQEAEGLPQPNSHTGIDLVLSLEQVGRSQYQEYQWPEDGMFVPTLEITVPIDDTSSGRTLARNRVTSFVRNTLIHAIDDAVYYQWRDYNTPNRPVWSRAIEARGHDSLMDSILNHTIPYINRWVEAWEGCDTPGCTSFHLSQGVHVMPQLGTQEPVLASAVGTINYLSHAGDQTVSYWMNDPAFTRGGGHVALESLVLAAAGVVLCTGCFDHWNQSDVAEYVHATNDSRQFLCDECDEGRASCDMCELRFLDDGSELNWADRYNDDTGEYEEYLICSLCARHSEPERLALMSYSHKPLPIFHGEDGAVYMGMELEVARRTASRTEEINAWIRSLPADMFYVKSDSSVRNGMEVVTHPFTYKWALDNFPYEKFEELLQISSIIPNDSSAGTHVHVNKSAFTKTHMWKFILFFIENKEFFGMLGDRGTNNSYGSFAASEDVRTNLYDLVRAKGNCEAIMLHTGRGAINVNPENTIEMRFLAGDVRPKMIKKNQQLIQSVYDFTKEVTARDALKGALGDPGYFLGYLLDTDYKELTEHAQSKLPMPKKLERSY